MKQLPIWLLCTLMAGCAEPASPAEVVPEQVVDPVEPGVALPVWQLGDYWTYDTPAGPVTYVVTEDMGGDWRIDITNERTAFIDARFDVSTIGPIRKADLAGQQGSDRVAYFQWPLSGGDSWTTTWDQVERTITTQQDGAIIRLAAMEGDFERATYTFDPAVGWFGEMVFKNDDGSPGFYARLQDSGSGFTGDVVRYTLTPLVEYSGASYHSATTVTVPDNSTDLWISFAVACSNGFAALTMGPLDQDASEEHVAEAFPCPLEAVQWTIADPVAGQWGISVMADGQDVDVELTVLARQLERIPVGSA